MSLLIRCQRLNHFLRSNNQTLQVLPKFPRHFSTNNEAGTETPTESQQQSEESTPIDPFLKHNSSGAVYGRLQGVNRHTLKTDIINLFEGCTLTLDDVKVDYNRMYNPVAMLVQFPSSSAYTAGRNMIGRKGRLFRLEKIDRSQWDITTPYNGRYVLLQGIPRNALLDDVERFLSGCDLDSSDFEMFTRQAFPDPIRMAKVRFHSQTEAMNAVIRKNRAFCLNTPVVARVLQ